MTFNVDRWAVRVLREGLLSTRGVVPRGTVWPVARWSRSGLGAVLFLRHWSSGRVEFDCAVSRRRAHWRQPSAWFGGPWVEMSEAPRMGGNERPILWIREEAIDMTPYERKGMILHLVVGVASPVVATIESAQGSRVSHHPVGQCGAFVVGVVNDTALLTATSSSGAPVEFDGGPLSLRLGDSSTASDPTDRPTYQRFGAQQDVATE